MYLKQKNGISLIILVITIIVILILSGTIVSSLNVSTENANLSVLVNDIAQLEESARAMYIMEDTLPIIDNAPKISREEIIDLVDTDNQAAFDEELELNGESENTYFYKLDLKKAGAGDVEYGTGANGIDDIYVISMNSLKVYYLKGVEYDGSMYFSINSKLANIISLPATFEDESSVTVNTFQAVTVSKVNSGYTSSLGIKIIANMEENEVLKFSFEGIEEKELNLSAGQNVMKIDTIADFNNYLLTPLSEEEITSFNNLTKDNSVIVLKKYNAGVLVGTSEIDISNYDNAAPNIEIVSIQPYDNFYVINGSISDTHGIAQSGAAQLKYDYQKISEVEKSFNEEYMKNEAKLASADESGMFSLKIPKEAGVVTVAAIDKAGNITIQDVELE